jgi:hypothetical protein
MTRIVAEPPTDQPHIAIAQFGRWTWRVELLDYDPGVGLKLGIVYPHIVDSWIVLGENRARAKGERELRKYSTRKARAARTLYMARWAEGDR